MASSLPVKPHTGLLFSLRINILAVIILMFFGLTLAFSNFFDHLFPWEILNVWLDTRIFWYAPPFISFMVASLLMSRIQLDMLGLRISRWRAAAFYTATVIILPSMLAGVHVTFYHLSEMVREKVYLIYFYIFYSHSPLVPHFSRLLPPSPIYFLPGLLLTLSASAFLLGIAQMTILHRIKYTASWSFSLMIPLVFCAFIFYWVIYFFDFS